MESIRIPIQGLEHLGRLFYAIAKADTKLAIEEYISFSNILKSRWQVMGTDIPEVMKSQFKKAQKENLDPEECFQSFIDYMHRNPTIFSKNIKELIFKTAHDIAYAFAKINKSELHLLARLSIEFKKVQP